MESSGAGARHGGKGEDVVGYLTASILNGRFAPGQRLVEGELTRTFRVDSICLFI